MIFCTLILLVSMLSCNLPSSESPFKRIMPTASTMVHLDNGSEKQKPTTLIATSTFVQPTVDSTATFTVQPTADSTATFTIEVQHTISPAALAPSLAWGGWGAGGGGREDCEDFYPNIYFEVDGGSVEPPIPVPGDEVAFGESLHVKGCEFIINEDVTVIFHLPNRDIETASVQVDTYGTWDVTWYSMPGDPIGRYDVEVITNDVTLTGYFTVTEPIMPTMMILCFRGMDEGLLLLTGFHPNEDVLIGRYGSGWGDEPNLIDHFYITVDQDGVASTTIPNEPTLVVAIGQEASVLKYSPMDDYELKVSAYDFCPWLH